MMVPVSLSGAELVQLTRSAFQSALANEVYFKELIARGAQLSRKHAGELLDQVVLTQKTAIAKILIDYGVEIEDYNKAFNKALRLNNPAMVELFLATLDRPVQIEDLYSDQIKELLTKHNTNLAKLAIQPPANFWQLSLEERRKVIPTIMGERRFLLEQHQGDTVKALCFLAKQGPPYLIPLLMNHALQRKEFACTTIPFAEACKCGDVERIRELLDKGAAIDAQEADGEKNSALMYAIMGGHVDALKLLFTHPKCTIAMKKKLIEARNVRGETPFIVACHKSHDKVVSAAASQSARTEEAKRLLTAYVEIAKILLDNGATFEEEDNTGLVPFYHAAASNHQPLVQCLLSRSDQRTVRVGYDEVLMPTALVGKNKAHLSPLLLAIRENNVKAFNCIFNAANRRSDLLLTKDEHLKLTAYTYAASCDNSDIMDRIFIAIKAHYDNYSLKEHIKDAFILICKLGRAKAIAKYFDHYKQAHPMHVWHDGPFEITRREAPDWRDYKDNHNGIYHINGLQIACIEGHVDIVNAICHEIKNFSGQSDYYKNTLLGTRGYRRYHYYSSSYGYSSVRSGAYSPNPSPLHYAAFYGHPQVVTILLGFDANPEDTCNMDRLYNVTALQLAQERLNANRLLGALQEVLTRYRKCIELMEKNIKSHQP